MMNAAIKSQPNVQPTLVAGLGLTGWSVVRYLMSKGEQLVVTDTREDPPYLEQMREEFPQVPFVHNLPREQFSEYQEVVASPGLAIQGKTVVGDVELFLRVATAPVIAITGSNGKSTVTMLVGEMLNAGSYCALVGGNIGTPALDLLDFPEPDFYVLELSSFQLETTHSLAASSAVVLNISEDHMDRYTDLDQYALAKLKIYQQAHCRVLNRDSVMASAVSKPGNDISFGLSRPDSANFGIGDNANQGYICQGENRIAPLSQLTLQGQQNVSNVLAAMALVAGAGVALDPAMVAATMAYPGLPHRCELVVNHNQIKWINDSKGTNVGATLAAINGSDKPVILIAGGRGKGADFSGLRPVVSANVKAVILIGEDAENIRAALNADHLVQLSDSLESAIHAAAYLAVPGDTILFSPACASFDMFDSYEHRGNSFKQLVLDYIEGLSDA